MNANNKKFYEFSDIFWMRYNGKESFNPHQNSENQNLRIYTKIDNEIVEIEIKKESR